MRSAARSSSLVDREPGQPLVQPILPALVAVLVGEDAPGGAVQPGQHRVGQLVEPPPRHDEHLGGEVAGPRLVPQTAQQEAKDRPVVQLVQVREPPLCELVDPHDRYVSGSRRFLTATPAIVLRRVHPQPP